MHIDSVDHLVLTVADVEATMQFYASALGMAPVPFGGRWALHFGDQKLNLHQAGAELLPHALRPQPGSVDLCLLTSVPITEVQSHLEDLGIDIIEGPVMRTGATGEILSVYFRDPDGNLIEVANSM